MPIKNYTTEIPASKTVAEIQKILSDHGVKAILLEYNDEGSPVGISFKAMTPFGLRGFRLPAHIEKTEAVLARQKVKCDHDKAARIAWRNIKDWIAAQMALIEIELVTIDEIFLPYMVDGNGRTLYETYACTGLLNDASDE